MYRSNDSLIPSFAAWTLLLSLGLSACGSGGTSGGGAPGGLIEARVMTFNTGIPNCSESPDAAYTCEDAEVAGEWYGTGLSHRSLFPDTRAFFDAVKPDVVGFQELFHAEDCPEIPVEFHAGFICEGWRPGDATVVQLILGEDYQIACHPGRSDKCLAVRKEFGRIRGCAGDFCLDHLQSGRTQGCGGGTRIARGVIDLANGGELVAVNIHGTSGITQADQECRVTQFQQVFVDIQDGSGVPAATGTHIVVLGDLNTDPGRFFLNDPSAATWREFVGSGRPFRQISDAGPLVTPTYLGLVNIDHVAGNVFAGECFTGEPTEIESFDHRPIVCDVKELD